MDTHSLLFDFIRFVCSEQVLRLLTFAYADFAVGIKYTHTFNKSKLDFDGQIYSRLIILKRYLSRFFLKGYIP